MESIYILINDRHIHLQSACNVNLINVSAYFPVCLVFTVFIHNCLCDNTDDGSQCLPDFAAC